MCYSPSLEQHLRDVREVLSILRQEKLYVNASKCAFGRSLTRLCGLHAPWHWGPEEKASFGTLKQCLTKAPVLRTFDWGCRSVVTTDASEVAISAAAATTLWHKSQWHESSPSRMTTAATTQWRTRAAS